MKFQFFGILFIVPVTLFTLSAIQAQSNHPITDCLGAQVLCSDSTFLFEPQGYGIDDFANPNNDEGCLTNFEVQSAWYYFEFQRSMPADSKIQFLVTPTSTPGPGVNRDFDFALYGPNLLCDSLGSPLRCSETFASGLPTGLDSTASENSERGVYPTEDGLVADLTVQPGEGYYLLLSNWDMSPTEFKISWGGSAAKWLNCKATPGCDFYAIDAGRDSSLCQSPFVQQIVLAGDTTGVGADEALFWTGTAAALALLDDPLALNPIVQIPAEFSGVLTYIINVGSGSCISSDTVRITVTGLPESPLPKDTFFCSNSTITLDGSSVLLDSYQWSDGTTGPLVTLDKPGAYSLNAIDTNACAASYDILLEEKPLPVPELPADTFFCIGTGGIRFDFGDTYKSYLWSNGSTESFFTAFFTQEVGLTVTDEFGCQASNNTSVEAKSPPNTFVEGERLICEGGSTTLTVADSTLRYRWNLGTTVATTRSIEVFEPGFYPVQVQDSLTGCTSFYPVQVRTAAPFNISISGDRQLCPDGALDIGIEDIYADYQWSTGQNSAQITVTQAGLYQLTVTGQNGCEGTGELNIQKVLTPELSLPDSLFLCLNGTVSLNTGDFFESYLWSDGQTQLNRNFSDTGSYMIEAFTNSGCVLADTLQVNYFNPPNQGITGDTLRCINESIALFVSETLAEISWSTGATEPIITVSQAGIYGVTVTDSNSCTYDYNIEVKDINALPPDPSITNPGGICPDEPALLSSSGGYSLYQWSTGELSPAIEVTEPGTYTLTVTDEFGCRASGTVTLERFQVGPLELSDTMVFCSNTTVNLDAAGPYQTWNWSDGSTTPSIQTDSEGLYAVSVLDLNGCTLKDSTELVQLESVLPILEDTFRVCPGDFVVLDAGPGFTSYDWSNGDTGRFTSTPDTGLFSVNLTDINGCDTKDTTLIMNFIPVAPVITVDPLLCEGTETNLRVEGDYIEYLWDSGDTLASLNIFQSGTYRVEVVDSNTCIQQAEITVNAIPKPEPELPAEGVLDCISNSLSLQASHPIGNFSYDWSGPDIDSDNRNLAQPVVTKEGTYLLRIRDLSTGCYSDTISTAVRLSQNQPAIELFAEGALDCTTNVVSINANGSSKGEVFSLRWLNPDKLFLESEQDYILNVSEPGTYYFELTNTEENCTLSDSITVVTDTDPPLANAGEEITLNCTTESGMLDGSKSDQGNIYRYRWQTTEGKILSGGSSLTPLVNQPGLYYLEVLNTGNGCQAIDSVKVLADFATPRADAGADIVLDCFGDGAVLNGTGSASGNFISYNWRSVEEHPLSNSLVVDPRIYDPGSYILYVLNIENGCSNRDTVQVFPPDNPPIGFGLKVSDPICFGDQNGEIIVDEVIQGNSPFLFSLNDKPFIQQSSFRKLSPGNYTLRVQDIDGCEYEQQVQLGYGREVKVDLGPDIEIKLGASFTLDAQINIRESEIGTLRWSSTTAELPCESCLRTVILPLETVNYGLELVDQFGCSGTDELNVVVTRPEAIFVPNSFSPNGDGLNDVLQIYAGPDVERINQFRIMDRWGEQVFGATDFLPNDPLYGWDGTFRGQALKPGVFAFALEARFVDGQTKIYSGSIHLIR